MNKIRINNFLPDQAKYTVEVCRLLKFLPGMIDKFDIFILCLCCEIDVHIIGPMFNTAAIDTKINLEVAHEKKRE